MSDTASAPGPSEARQSAEQLVAQLTTEEKVTLLSGSDVWRTAPVERLGLPPVKVSDGPNGVRGDRTSGATAVCLPAAIAMAATFDVDLVVELGRLLGRETVRKAAQILLGPTINMARHPLGGRNFESFGEEPILTSAMAVAYIDGVQSEGVGACAKHFVANDVEESRLTVSSEVDPVTLREVYLAPFEAAVGAGVWSVMAAYPKLNGEHCTENGWLLTTVLRDEWGFDGLVMSDWGATHHPVRSVAAGLDLEMPGPAKALGPKLLAAVESGAVPMAVLDQRAADVVALALRAGRLEVAEEPERAVDEPEERELVRRAAAAAMVLLTNRPPDGAGVGSSPGPVLPLQGDEVSSIAIVGPNAEVGVIQGGGSAQLSAHYSISPLAGLSEARPDIAVTHRQGCVADRYLPMVAPDAWAERAGDGGPLLVEIYGTPEPDGEPAVTRRTGRLFGLYQGGNTQVSADRWSQRWTGRLRIETTGKHRFGVLAVGRARVSVDGRLVVDNWTDPRPGQAFFERASEEVIGVVDLDGGTEAEIVVEWSSDNVEDLVGLRFGWQPPIDEDRMLADAVAAAEAADVAVVVVGLTAEWETEGHDRAMFGLPGRQDELVERVVAANPRTVVVVNAGGPVDLPWLDRVPATLMAWYPGQEFGRALADVLFGDRDPGGRLPITFPQSLDDAPTATSLPGDGVVLHYREGVFVGHRWYDEQGIQPRLPFGHGLSYATFELGAPSIVGASAGHRAAGGPAVRVPVANVGDRPGTCVVQVYLRPGIAGRPRVLAGFATVALEPGAERTVAVELLPQALRRWDVDRGRWLPLAGDHRLEIGTSSAAIEHELDFTVPF